MPAPFKRLGGPGAQARSQGGRAPDNQTMTQTPDTIGARARQDSLLEFPCVFPIKVMGLKVAAFTPAMLAIARAHDDRFDPDTLEIRESSAGKYLGLTLKLHVASQAELDAVYRELSGHPLVKVVL